MFLENAILAFNSDAVDIKKTVVEQDKKIDELHRQLGKRTAELEWASKSYRAWTLKLEVVLSNLNFYN